MTKTSVLLVDDEKDFVDLLALRLETRGYETHRAYNGAEAMAFLQDRDVDVVVLDVHMPGKSGLETLQDIKTLNADTEVIILTGQSSLHTAVAGMKQGAHDYLLKPVDIEVLTQSISQARSSGIKREERLRMIETGKMAAVGLLAQGVAHEINNPVNIMVQEAGWIEDLLDEDDAPDPKNLAELRRAAAQIRAQGKRCREITRRLLGLKRTLDPRRSDTSLNAVLKKTLEAAAPRIEASRVQVTTSFAPDLPLLLLSPEEIEQVFRNLVANALDAMEGQDGTLAIATAEDEGNITVTFRDTGRGIAKADQQRIFEPFYSTKEVGKGPGLGLSICFSVINTLGGEITVQSEPGEGATFVVRIPSPAAKGRGPAREETPGAAPRT